MPESRETITEQLSLATVQMKTLVERLNTDSTIEDFAIVTECLKKFSQLIDRLIAPNPDPLEPQADTRGIAKGACGAVLGSAIALVQ